MTTVVPQIQLAVPKRINAAILHYKRRQWHFSYTGLSRIGRRCIASSRVVAGWRDVSSDVIFLFFVCLPCLFVVCRSYLCSL